MKIIFLNALAGEVKAPLTQFISHHAPTTDVFCFQEAYDFLLQICRERLPNFHKISAYKKLENDEFPQATFIKKNLQVIDQSIIFPDDPVTGLGIYARLREGNESLNLCNFHGISVPGDKLDNPGRLAQSRGLIDFFKNLPEPKIIGGDFNLLPDTESISSFEDNGYINLIKKFNIPTTRNKLAWKNYPNKQLFADYIFVSPSVEVKSFSVPNITISDHLPLILETE